MGKKKLQRFAEMETFENVIQPTHEQVWVKDYKLKGNWHKEFFNNDNPIVLEVGCGKGEYTVGMARKYPGKNFIGIDIKGARMWRGAKTALEEKLDNVAFVRTKAELLNSLFAPGEISEIWITFPDPQMKRVRKRLTSTRFLDLYKNLLSVDGIIHLKTDSRFLYEYTSHVTRVNELKVLTNNNDIYGSDLVDDILSIHTFYEEQFLARGIPIKYISFMLNGKSEFEEPDVEIELDPYRSFGRDRKV